MPKPSRLIDAFSQEHFPFLDLLGIQPLSAGEGEAKMTLRVDQRHLRVGGIAHGGVVASLLDSVVGMAAATLVTDQGDLVTAQLNMNFLRPARPGNFLTATGRVLHAGRKTAVVDARIVDQRDNLIGSATATMLYLASLSEESPASD